MANPIEDTPVLYGIDADRFLKEIDENLKKCDSVDKKEKQKQLRKLLKTKFKWKD